MSADFTVKEGLFWLDGEPVFLQAGEFHYFRTPPDQWPHRLNLLKQAGFNAVASYIPWRWHQVEEDVSDFDGHSHPMRDLAGFLDLAAAMGLWIIARPGPYIMAETINEGIPSWVFDRYPQVAFVDQHNRAQNVVSYLHPDFLACVSKWYRAVFQVLTPRQITRGGRIVLIQLDNEMGMIQWVRNILDTNPDTLARFAEYLRRTFGERLAQRYPTDSLTEFLRDSLLSPQEPHGARVVEDYRRFYRSYLREYASFLCAEAKANGMEVPPVANIHGFANGGKTFPIGLSQLVDVLRILDMISATDVYPGHIGEGTFHQLLLVNEMTKAVQNPAQPLFSIEFQAGGNNDFSDSQSSLYDLHGRLCISVGMRAINHYLFFDGENDPLLSPVKRHDWGHPVRKDGSLRRHYFRYPKLSRALAAYGEALIRARPHTVTTIGFCLDDFMTEVNNRLSQPRTDILTHQRETILFDMIARGLALTHRPFDAVDVARAQLDASRIPLLWMMMDRECDAAIQRKLVAYVRQGGRLILAGRMCLEDSDHQGCTLLKDAFGLTDIRSDAPFTPSAIDAFGYRDVPVSFVETYRGDFDEVIATRQGEPVGFVKTVGKGQVLMFGAALPIRALDDLDIVHQMALKMGCAPAFTLSDWADVRLCQGTRGSFLFVNNYQDDPIETRISWNGAPLFGGNAISLPARQGAILPLDWRVDAGAVVRYLTAEVVQVAREATSITLETAQREFAAELLLDGWECDGGETVEQSGQTRRIRLRGTEGRIHLRKAAPPLRATL
ncbi:MAG: beta-galactosidase [Anaerolineales bacterium]